MKRTTKGISLPALRDLREQKSLTRKAISDAIGINLATLYRLETGRTGASPQTAEDLARYFGVPLETLKNSVHISA